jgi:hypothetical protein
MPDFLVLLMGLKVRKVESVSLQNTHKIHTKWSLSLQNPDTLVQKGSARTIIGMMEDKDRGPLSKILCREVKRVSGDNPGSKFIKSRSLGPLLPFMPYDAQTVYDLD